VLNWCLDLIRHNIGTKLKLNKYIFDISIPFCHHLYLSATLKPKLCEILPKCCKNNYFFTFDSKLRLTNYLKITDQSNRTYEFSPYWHVNMIEGGLGQCKFCEVYILLLELSNVRAQYIRKTADLLLQLWVSTFPRFVTIGFYFLSETLI
jgi:hypothetical protein